MLYQILEVYGNSCRKCANLQKYPRNVKELFKKFLRPIYENRKFYCQGTPKVRTTHMTHGYRTTNLAEATASLPAKILDINCQIYCFFLCYLSEAFLRRMFDVIDIVKLILLIHCGRKMM